MGLFVSDQNFKREKRKWPTTTTRLTWAGLSGNPSPQTKTNRSPAPAVGHGLGPRLPSRSQIGVRNWTLERGTPPPLGGTDGANLNPIGAANPSRRGNSGNTNPVIGQTNGAPLGGANGVNRNPIGVAVPQFENRAPRHVRNIFPGPAPDFFDPSGTAAQAPWGIGLGLDGIRRKVIGANNWWDDNRYPVDLMTGGYLPGSFEPYEARPPAPIQLWRCGEAKTRITTVGTRLVPELLRYQPKCFPPRHGRAK